MILNRTNETIEFILRKLNLFLVCIFFFVINLVDRNFNSSRLLNHSGVSINFL